MTRQHYSVLIQSAYPKNFAEFLRPPQPAHSCQEMCLISHGGGGGCWEFSSVFNTNVFVLIRPFVLLPHIVCLFAVIHSGDRTLETHLSSFVGEHFFCCGPQMRALCAVNLVCEAHIYHDLTPKMISCRRLKVVRLLWFICWYADPAIVATITYVLIIGISKRGRAWLRFLSLCDAV